MRGMNDPSQDNLRQVVETFWETFLPFWHSVKAYTRQVAWEQFDLSIEQFHILRHIRRGQGSVSELAEAKDTSRPAISQAVEVLVQAGLITRTTDTRDRRHVQLALTDSGNAQLDAIFENVRRWMMQTLSPLSDAELLAWMQTMDSLRKIKLE